MSRLSTTRFRARRATTGPATSSSNANCLTCYAKSCPKMSTPTGFRRSSACSRSMMSSANAYLTVGGLGIDVVYKDIKNLHISVYPPVGRVRVAAPERMDDDTIRRAVVQRLPWIKRQRDQLLSADRQTEREMVSGETHYVWGQRFRLDVSRSSG